jgi:hypothetical protein
VFFACLLCLQKNLEEGRNITFPPGRYIVKNLELKVEIFKKKSFVTVITQ